MIGHYNYGLVALSVVIAFFTSHAALDLAGRTWAAHGARRRLWLLGGASVAVGARGLAAVWASLDHLARGVTSEGTSELVVELEAEFARVHQALLGLHGVAR